MSISEKDFIDAAIKRSDKRGTAYGPELLKLYGDNQHRAKQARQRMNADWADPATATPIDAPTALRQLRARTHAATGPSRR